MASKIVKRVALATSFLVLISGFGLWYFHPDFDLRNSQSKVKASSTWDIGDLGNVRMLIENTKRYQLDTEEGGKEWESLVPEDGGIVFQERNEDTGELEAYTVSMFHELRCLNVIRLELVRPTRFEQPPPNEPLVTHCLNYIRQTVLCRSDLYVENVKTPIGPHDVDITHVRTCKDWNKVYDAAANRFALKDF
ncbi:hypothetical protein SCHPADRAFT_938889 [Schizopora paradoxa]|uniref:Uncharacterized protein n=1 Tax=Schizopora paradoxa TaxID=27342 RepID=A0A0H2RTJ4_9AGAM|nr:hypothetical protein SCHPADRAFT_938889 [Schizopora paradoxa]